MIQTKQAVKVTSKFDFLNFEVNGGIIGSKDYADYMIFKNLPITKVTASLAVVESLCINKATNKAINKVCKEHITYTVTSNKKLFEMGNYINKAIYDRIPKYEIISSFNNTYIDSSVSTLYKLNTKKGYCELEIIIVCAVDNYDKLIDPENVNKLERLKSYCNIEDTNTKADLMTEQLEDYVTLIYKHNKSLNR